MNPALLTIILALTDKTPRLIHSDFLNSCAAFEQPSSLCQAAWDGFAQAFSGKDPCAITIGDYSPYFRIFPLPSVIGRTLLWSKLAKLEEALSSQPSVALTSSSTLLSSSVVNYMQQNYNVTTWCGTPGGGIDYVHDCPPLNQVGTPEYTFWAEFSRRLGTGSSGVVYYLTPGFFNGTATFFGLYELPAILRAGSPATKLVVLNVIEEGQTACGTGSLRTLREKVLRTRPSLAFECYNVFGNGSDPSSELISRLVDVIHNTSDPHHHCRGAVHSGAERAEEATTRERGSARCGDAKSAGAARGRNAFASRAIAARRMKAGSPLIQKVHVQTGRNMNA